MYSLSKQWSFLKWVILHCSQIFNTCMFYHFGKLLLFIQLLINLSRFSSIISAALFWPPFAFLNYYQLFMQATRDQYNLRSIYNLRLKIQQQKSFSKTTEFLLTISMKDFFFLISEAKSSMKIITESHKIRKKGFQERKKHTNDCEFYKPTPWMPSKCRNLAVTLILCLIYYTISL